MGAVAVIGAGPAGLAVAACLRAHGIPTEVLERDDAVGATWRRHYDRLHLHTPRRLSGLPGLPIPRAYGRWVHRDDVVRYLEAYARHHGLEIRTGVRVARVERRDDGWRLETSRGPVDARSVVVATGYSHAPFVPAWPGRFAGELIHASSYRSPASYRGRKVLVVGTGNTGAEIAVDLVEGGAAEVRLAARTPPTILPRAFAGVPTQALGILLRPVSPRVVDPVVAAFARLTIGSLEKHGLSRPPRGVYTRARVDGVLPILDVGLVAALRAGKVRAVPGIEGFDGPEVLLAGGERWAPDAVIAATGYRRGLEPLCGHLGVLDERGCPRANGPDTVDGAGGLHFVGFTMPISGALREIGRQAKATARAIRDRHAAAPRRTLEAVA